jgi:hypothetical protein
MTKIILKGSGLILAGVICIWKAYKYPVKNTGSKYVNFRYYAVGFAAVFFGILILIESTGDL